MRRYVREPFNPSYTGSRPDLARLVPSGARRLLDVGCSTGVFGEHLRSRRPELHVVGVERDERMAEVARTRLDAVRVLDLERQTLSSALHDESFDCIVFGDVLEHLVDPWAVLRDAVCLLSPSGAVVTSVPNVRHISSLFNLVYLDEWSYAARGLHDRSHLRYFTGRTIRRLLCQAGLTVVREARNLRFIDRSWPVNRLAVLFDWQPFRGFLTYQYLHVSVRATSQG